MKIIENKYIFAQINAIRNVAISKEEAKYKEYDNLDEIEDEDNDIDDSEFEDCAVCDVDFLCANEFDQEHDVDWHTFDIEFYGVWGKEGVFSVY